jgi:hypothetical protein
MEVELKVAKVSSCARKSTCLSGIWLIGKAGDITAVSFSVT